MDGVTRPKLIRFAAFAADLEAGEIRKHGVRLRLQQQPFEVLAALLERPGQIVTRDELRKRLWTDGVFVDYDRGLNKAVNRLREVLGDNADQPQYIETVPQRGYRFIGLLEPVEPVPVKVETRIEPPEPSPPILRGRISPFAAGGLIVTAVAFAFALSGVRLVTPGIESIAVLPLENLSGDPDQEFFSDGMTDELIGELAHISSLHVISRTSVMRYKGGQRKALPEIARELNADAIVEGTVTKVGDRVRITAQLIRARDDRHLWSQKYERDLRDVLTLQGEVARAIAMEIRASLKPEERNRWSQLRRIDPEAYQAFLKGNFFLHQNIRGVQNSITWFRRAIELDPEYAEAHAGLAHALIYSGIYEFRPFAEAYGEARVAAQRALELDPSSASAHNALADVKKGLDWDFEGAEQEHHRALELSPSHLLTRLWHAESLSRLERHDEALAESARAVSLDPVSALSHNNRAMLLWRARRFDEAIHEAQIALELDPSHVNALWWQGLAFAGKRDFARSLECLQRGLEISRRAPMFLASLGYVYALNGERDRARSALAELHDMAQMRHVSPANFATVYAGLGDADATFKWLEKTYESRDGRVHQLVWPCFDQFRQDPRYRDLKDRIGLGRQLE